MMHLSEASPLLDRTERWHGPDIDVPLEIKPVAAVPKACPPPLSSHTKVGPKVAKGCLDPEVP